MPALLVNLNAGLKIIWARRKKRELKGREANDTMSYNNTFTTLARLAEGRAGFGQFGLSGVIFVESYFVRLLFSAINSSQKPKPAPIPYYRILVLL